MIPYREDHPLFTEGFRDGMRQGSTLVGSVKDQADLAQSCARIATSEACVSYFMGAYEGLTAVYWLELMKIERAKRK